MTSPRTMLNCGASGRVEFTFRCPMTWDALDPTGDPNRRDCARCHRTVFRVHNAVDAALRATEGECIAVPVWLADGVRASAEAHGQRIVVGRARSPADLVRDAVAAHTGEPIDDLKMTAGPRWG